MKKITPNGPLAKSIKVYLAHKYSLGKQLVKQGAMLYMLDGYLSAQGVTNLGQITPAHIEAFVNSRVRPMPRSYNELLGALRGLFDWLVAHEVLPESPFDANLAASRHRADRSCSTQSKCGASSKLRQNCPAILGPWIAVRYTRRCLLCCTVWDCASARYRGCAARMSISKRGF